MACLRDIVQISAASLSLSTPTGWGEPHAGPQQNTSGRVENAQQTGGRVPNVRLLTPTPGPCPEASPTATNGEGRRQRRFWVLQWGLRGGRGGAAQFAAMDDPCKGTRRQQPEAAADAPPPAGVRGEAISCLVPSPGNTVRGHAEACPLFPWSGLYIQPCECQHPQGPGWTSLSRAGTRLTAGPMRRSLPHAPLLGQYEG